MPSDHLEHYQEALTRLNNAGSSQRVETRIRFNIFDQISEIEITFPPSCFTEPMQKVELFNISSKISGRKRTLEITGLKGDKAKTEIGFLKTNDLVRFYACPCEDACKEGINIKFEAWEIVSLTKGVSPFDLGGISLEYCFGEKICNGEHILMLDYPKSQTPRSTQGTHDFAYPSRTIGERRVQPLYFHSRKPVELDLIVGTNDSLATPWVSLFKTSVSGFFVAAIASQIDATTDSIKFFFGLLAAFVAATAVIWDAIENLGKVQLYLGKRQNLSFLILAFQFALRGAISVLILSVLEVELLSLNLLLPVVLFLACTTLAIAILGYSALLSGRLHGYRCDHLGCDVRFKWRRFSVNECYYTGRVYCGKHVKTVCESCVHHADLGRSQARTSDQYSFDSPRCVVEKSEC